MKYLFLLIALSACSSTPTIDVEKEQLKQALSKYTEAEKKSVVVNRLDIKKIKALSDVTAILDVLDYKFTETAFTTKEDKAKLEKIRPLFLVEPKQKEEPKK